MFSEDLSRLEDATHSKSASAWSGGAALSSRRLNAGYACAVKPMGTEELLVMGCYSRCGKGLRHSGRINLKSIKSNDNRY
jgi:hypothetical protein